MAQSKLYYIWHNMKQSVNNKNKKQYASIQQKGIQYTPEWEEFKNFETWALNNNYQEGLRLIRIDHDRDFCPDNCIFGTPKERQLKAHPKMQLLEYNGLKLTIREWSKITDLSHQTIRNRLKLEYTIGQTLGFEPLPIKPKGLVHNGTFHTLDEWSKLRNIPVDTIISRINRNMNTHDILELKT